MDSSLIIRTLYEVHVNYTIMRLVWALIPLMLFGIIGISESYAEKDPTMLQATSTDGSIIVEITPSIPKEDETMSIGLKFVYANSGGIVRHINYDLLVIQDEQIVLDEMGKHNHKGLGTHKTVTLTSDDPVDVTITLQGIGTDPPLKGPMGDTIGITVDAVAGFTMKEEKRAMQNTIDTERDTMMSEMQEKSKNSDNGGCLITTATYGTELAPQVQLLREIRDNILFSTNSGTSFMVGFNQFYYSFSPTIADWERENPLFQKAIKIMITPLLSSLSIMTLAEEGSESQVLTFGVSVIVLNLGMYIVVPLVVIWQVRKRI